MLEATHFLTSATSATICQFWLSTLDLIYSFSNGPMFNHLPLVPMPLYNNDALLPLPTTPLAGFCLGLSCYAKIVEDALELEDALEIEDAEDVPLPPGA